MKATTSVGYLKMMCILTVLVIVLIPLTSTKAEIASEAEMDQACRNWIDRTVLESGDWAGVRETEISFAKTYDMLQDGILLARVYNLKPDGFIVVPSLMEMSPIMAYSERGHLSIEDDENSLWCLLRDVLANRITRFVELYGDMKASQIEATPMFSESHRLAWDHLLKSELRSEREQVGPLLSTTWHQTAPYNNYCPWGDGNRSVAWCVAVALAQIIRFHEWPPSGFGNTDYLWNGDQSCGGNSPGLYLTANFSDSYGYNDTDHDVAELCMEVGKAYHVDYGVCYSVGDTSPTYTLLPDFFAYYDSVQDNYRSDFTVDDWFGLIQNEVNNDRPIDYLIFNHMIVCDGWMTSGLQKYYHMNYGWGGGNTLWYALDGLHCDWAGCDPMIEHMYTNIKPDRRIMFYADTLAGYAPLDIQFTASSDLDVIAWNWSFGDGGTSELQNPQHTYSESGIYDVTLRINYDSEQMTAVRSEYIYVISDSIRASSSAPIPGNTLEIDIAGDNLLDLTRIILPVSYGGDLNLRYDSCSVAECRTWDFQYIAEVDIDSANQRLTLDLCAWQSGYSTQPYLLSGSGSIVKLYFTVPSDALPGQSSTIDFSGYGSYMPIFYGSIHGFEHTYMPLFDIIQVALESLCGDTDASGGVDIDDVVYLIAYVFQGGPEPIPVESGNADCEGVIDIDDIVYLIDYLFLGGDPPCDPDGNGVPDC